MLDELGFRALNFFQSPFVPLDECHKIFTCPYMILHPTSNFHSIFLNQISDQIHIVSFYRSFHTVGSVSPSISGCYGHFYAQNDTNTSQFGITENPGLP